MTGRVMTKSIYDPKIGLFTVLLVLLTCSCILSAPFSVARAADLKMIGEGIFQEEKSGKVWQLKQSKRFKTEEEVNNHLLQLNSGEYDDWRLPTKQELYELFVVFDFKKNGDVAVPKEGSYWYADEYGEMEVGAWEEGDG